MGWKLPAMLALLLLAAAAAPPGDCTQGGDSEKTLPSSIDLAGRPSVSAGLSGRMFAPLPSTDGNNGCRSPLASSSQSTTLRTESGDVLHGLPVPDILRPINEPRRAPQFQ